MNHEAVARSIAAAAQASLAALSTVSYLLPSKKPLKEGLEALRVAYNILGVSEAEVPWKLCESDQPVAPPSGRQLRDIAPKAPSVRAVRRKRKAKERDAEDEESSDNILLEASRCRALLLEVVRRAVHDWVLYRQQQQRDLKILAHNAYVWLFEEKPGHPWWEEREEAQVVVRGENEEVHREVGARVGTSFLAICEATGIDPEKVREQARKMTVESILRRGRPAERRTVADSVSLEEHGVAVDVDLHSLDEPSVSEESYVGYTSYV